MRSGNGLPVISALGVEIGYLMSQLVPAHKAESVTSRLRELMDLCVLEFDGSALRWKS